MSIFLIIPCYNEKDRLDRDEFTKFAKEKDYKFIFANDGSSDGTLEILNSLSQACPENCFVYDAPTNRGKAEVIRHAFHCFDNKDFFGHDDWIGYWDADLATPLWEVENMFAYAKAYEKNINSIWGSRLLRLGANIRRSSKRHYLGRIFATIVGFLLKVSSYDSQCGAKLFDYSTAKQAFANPFISNWIFDVEILLRLKNKEIIEYPLRQWEDIPGSKVKISKDIFRVIKDLLVIWKNYR